MGKAVNWAIFGQNPGKAALLAELLVIYGCGPLVVLVWVKRPLPLILLGGVLFGLFLLKDPGFDKKRLWNPAGMKAEMKRVLGLFAILAFVISVLVFLLQPDSFFVFPRSKPALWLLVILLYPLLAVYPQEIIYRAYFFRRYIPLVKRESQLIHLSALCFAFGHVVYLHPLSVFLTIGGGYLFGYTYLKSRSLLAAALEHALYGCLVYTIGLGQYFYSGALRFDN